MWRTASLMLTRKIEADQLRSHSQGGLTRQLGEGLNTGLGPGAGACCCFLTHSSFESSCLLFWPNSNSESGLETTRFYSSSVYERA